MNSIMNWRSLFRWLVPSPPPLTDDEHFQRIEREIAENRTRIERLERHLRLRRLGVSNGH